MKAYKIKLFFWVLFFMFSCKSKNKKINIDSNTYAIGILNKDSTFDGYVSFFNLPQNNLISQCNYTNGKLNGERKDYFKNGSLKLISNYDYGKKYGYITSFNENGTIKTKEFYFYDIKMGGFEKFSNNKINYYSFTNLHGEELFVLNYDKILNYEITNLVENYFFIYLNQSFIASNIEKEYAGSDYLIYMPTPPKYSFKYALVELEAGTYNVKNIIENFDENKQISLFSINYNGGKEIEYAIRLIIKDSINKYNTTLFKKINMK